MSDLKLATKNTPLTQPVPPQPGNPSEFFGEGTNDLQLNSVNDFALVSGVEKLKQDLNKILLTELEANPRFPIYGTELESLIGNKVDQQEIRGRIRDQVESALSVILLINRDNENGDEVPEIFESLSVEELEPTKFEVRISVITRSGKRVVSDGLSLG